MRAITAKYLRSKNRIRIGHEFWGYKTYAFNSNARDVWVDAFLRYCWQKGINGQFVRGLTDKDVVVFLEVKERGIIKTIKEKM